VPTMKNPIALADGTPVGPARLLHSDFELLRTQTSVIQTTAIGRR
jgi:hypothetical protein